MHTEPFLARAGKNFTLRIDAGASLQYTESLAAGNGLAALADDAAARLGLRLAREAWCGFLRNDGRAQVPPQASS